MASTSIGIPRGKGGFSISDFVQGTAAPSANTDVEVRFNNTDTNGKNLNREEIYVLAKQIVWYLLQGQGLQLPAGTPVVNQPVGPPS